MADQFAPMPVKTKTAGDVSVNIASGQTVGLVAGSAKVGVVTTDQTTHGTTDLVAADTTKIAGTTIDTNSGTKSAGTQRVVLATDQPALTNALKVDGSATTQPVSGTFWQATQPVSGTVTANAGTGTMTVGQATGTNLHVVVDSGTITTSGGGLVGTVTDDYSTSASLAAGATVTLDSTNIASGTGHLTEATVSSSVALKAQLGTWDGTTFTIKRTFFVPANGSIIYTTTRSDEIQKATGATAKFRWSITNNDNANAADVYCSTTYYYA